MNKLATLSLTLLAAAMVLHPAPVAAQGSSAPAKSGAQASPSTGQKTQNPAAASPLKDTKDKASYALGMNLGASLRRAGVALDPSLILMGINDALAGKQLLITPEEGQAALNQIQAELMAKQEAKRKEEGEANKKEGDDFLAANKTKPGVVTTASGLQYKIITTGAGPKPAVSDTVVCNYSGKFVDGKQFDASKPGEPAQFQLGRVIKGWTEALQLMPVGSKWQLFIPSDLAYGPGGFQDDIPPNKTLIFEVELVSIQGK